MYIWMHIFVYICALKSAVSNYLLLCLHMHVYAKCIYTYPNVCICVSISTSIYVYLRNDTQIQVGIRLDEPSGLNDGTARGI
jgi:hypothetical protein